MPDWYGQLVTIRDVIDGDPGAEVLLVKMDGPRLRSDGAGRSSSIKDVLRAQTDKYPGDAKMCDATLITVQIHWLQIDDATKAPVPALAVHIPKALRKDDVIAQGA